MCGLCRRAREQRDVPSNSIPQKGNFINHQSVMMPETAWGIGSLCMSLRISRPFFHPTVLPNTPIRGIMRPYGRGRSEISVKKGGSDCMEFQVNSSILFVLVGAIIALVVAQSVFFLARAVKRAKELGIAKDTVKKTITSAAVFTIAPAVAVLVGVVALSKSLGVALPCPGSVCRSSAPSPTRPSPRATPWRPPGRARVPPSPTPPSSSPSPGS